LKENRFRVLVVEHEPDRIQLLEEAFTEMAERHFAQPAMPFCQRDYALSWQEAAANLPRIASLPEILLVQISGHFAPSRHAFQQLRRAAPGVAIVLMLADTADEDVAIDLIRSGAQDYVRTAEIDCEPLARILRCSVERNRLAWARQNHALLDDLTGLYNRRGMAMLSERDSRLAASLHLRPWTVELRVNSDGEREDGDMQRLELAEQLKTPTQGGPLAGRAAEDDFVLLGLAPSEPEAWAYAHAVARQLEERRLGRGLSIEVRVSHDVSMRESVS